MKWMEKIARCSHAQDVEIEAKWDEAGPYLLRICPDCGRVMGWNRNEQRWQFLATMGSTTWILRRAEMVSLKNRCVSAGNLSLKDRMKKPEHVDEIDVHTAPSGIEQFE